MSRIIRNIQAQQTEGKEIKIQPYSFFQPHTVDEYEHVHEEPQLTQEQLLAERDQLLLEAQQQIAAERAQFEQEKANQLAAVEQLRQIWEEEKPALQQQAYEEAFAAGYEEGVQKAAADMQQAVQQANETMITAKENAQAYLDGQEAVILELGLTVAERILHIELERNDAVFVEVVKRGLKEAREMKEIKIYTSPDYHAIVSKHREELAELFPVDVPFMIFVNEDLNGTECYIETNHGRIVVSMDTQLHELRLKLREILESKE